MKKIISFLYSTRLMAILFVLYATAMGVATFIENDFGTQTSKALIYNAWWFELIMVFFVINFFGNIFRYRLLRKEKWPVLLFHVSFLLILIGAGITRYIGYEGVMPIDEGETTNSFLSETTYLNVVIDDNVDQAPKIHKKMLLSAWGKNNFEFDTSFGRNRNAQQEINFKLVDYIPWAEKKLVLDENGEEHLFFVESSEGSRHEHYIKKGTIQNIHGILVGFNAPNQNASVNFFKENGSLKMVTKESGDWFRMADQKRGLVVKDSVQNFQYLTLHNVAGLQFVIPKPAEKGTIQMVSGPKDDTKLDVVIFDITTNNVTERVTLTGGQYNTQGAKEVTVANLNFRMLYGSKFLETPFKIKLNDFQLEKYPGSENAASFASEITVIDPNETFDYRIFMNNILDYKGYKFFQASYDLSGEVEQTRLSVNHDFWGTFVTYLGYSMLYFGMISLFFAKHTRFDDLKKSLKKLQRKKSTIAVIACFLFFNVSNAQQSVNQQQRRITDQQIDSILKANLVAESHAESFSKLIIQDAGGRMKPAHTFASELVRKVSQTNNFNGMKPSQVLMSIIENRLLWFEVPFIYLEKGNTQIRAILGLEEKAKYARLSDFYDAKGNSKIDRYIQEAQKKNIQNKFEKDVIKIGRRLWLFNSALMGSVLKIYPIPGDENNKWISQPEVSRVKFKALDSIFVRQSLPAYVQVLQEAKKTQDYTFANKILSRIKSFQKEKGSAVYPSDNKIELEILYNNYQPFLTLSK
ncbi:MAG: cytochrome c biogenesis protein ResB, partial [Polaribacter sp.]